MIHTFSCEATLHIHHNLHHKLDDHSIPGIHIGITQGKKVFLVYDPQTCKVHKSWDVHFFENTKSILECVMIEVEPYDSPTHVVVPVENESIVNPDNIDRRMDHEKEMDLADAIPEPEQIEPHHSGHICCAPIPDDDSQYEKSTYNRDSDSVGVT